MPCADSGRRSAGGDDPFWQVKKLAALTPAEWEQLCDGCGRCCLHRYRNPKTGRVYETVVACYLLDTRTCRCKAYEQRRQRVLDCTVLTPANVSTFRWLPATCAYRLRAEGRPLQAWHPLIAGDARAMHAKGLSVRNFAISEEHVHPDDLEAYILRGAAPR